MNDLSKRTGLVRLIKADVAKIAEINIHTLSDWLSRRYIVPDFEYPGRGKISFFSEINAVEATLLKAATDAGISAEVFARTFKNKHFNKRALNPFIDTDEGLTHVMIVIDKGKTVRFQQWNKNNPDYIPVFPSEIHDVNFEIATMINLNNIFLKVTNGIRKL